MRVDKKARLEFFERGFAQQGLEVGAISTSVFIKYIRFKDYQLLISSGYSDREAMKLTAQRTKSSFSSVWRAVQYFR